LFIFVLDEDRRCATALIRGGNNRHQGGAKKVHLKERLDEETGQTPSTLHADGEWPP
jgi:hypothetical protein